MLNNTLVHGCLLGSHDHDEMKDKVAHVELIPYATVATGRNHHIHSHISHS